MTNEKNVPETMQHVHKKLSQIASRLNVLYDAIESKEGAMCAGPDVLVSIEALGDDVRHIATIVRQTIQ